MQVRRKQVDGSLIIMPALQACASLSCRTSWCTWRLIIHNVLCLPEGLSLQARAGVCHMQQALAVHLCSGLCPCRSVPMFACSVGSAL